MLPQCSHRPGAQAIARWTVTALDERGAIARAIMMQRKREQRPASPAGHVTFRPGGPQSAAPGQPGARQGRSAHRLPAGPPGYGAGLGRVPGRRYGTGAGRRTGRPTTASPAARRCDRPAGLQTARPARRATRVTASDWPSSKPDFGGCPRLSAHAAPTTGGWCGETPDDRCFKHPSPDRCLALKVAEVFVAQLPTRSASGV